MSNQKILPGTSENIDLSECISILDFISSIQQNNKPCYKTKTTISKQGWLVTIRRRWAGEKGEEGVLFINNLLCSCDIHYRMCLKNSEIGCDIDNLCLSLKNSISGFSNLINTYSDQKSISDDYAKIKNKVISLCDQIRNYLDKKPKKIDETEKNKNENELVPVIISDNSTRSNFFTTNNITFMVSKYNNK